MPDIRLGTLVTSATFRHPSMTAIAVAQIDDISGGRMELGIGTGWFEAEHTAYGLDFGTSFGERFDRLTEQLEIITGLWATPIGGTFDHTGTHYTLAGAPGLPKPRAARAAGHGPGCRSSSAATARRRTPALAARFADEFNVGFSDLEVTTTQFGRVRAACEDGRPRSRIRWSIRWRTRCASGRTRPSSRRRAAAIGREPEEARSQPVRRHGRTRSSTPSARWAAAGVQRAYLQVLDLSDLDHIALIAAEVLPAVRDA